MIGKVENVINEIGDVIFVSLVFGVVLLLAMFKGTVIIALLAQLLGLR